PDKPTASIFRLPTARFTARVAAFHQSAGLCSAQPGWGTRIVSGSDARAIVRPRPSTTIALTLVVPTSMPRKRLIGTMIAWAEDGFAGWSPSREGMGTLRGFP